MSGTNQQVDAKQRKRDAVGNLRDLAAELGLQVERRRPDLTKGEFDDLQKKVTSAARTPDHKRRVKEFVDSYMGSTGAPVLPALPSLPPFPDATAERGESAAVEFRIRSSSCLFTWNNVRFATMDSEHLWETFVAWLRQLEFVRSWTATIEKSLHSDQQGRLHLHAFTHFTKAVDWTSTEKMRFLDSLPNASPTQARGDNLKAVRDQGHFYCWAWKVGTIKVQTSGYEPWRDYAVKGFWIDQLWTEHKLAHDTYLEYAERVRIGFLTRLKQVEAIKARECERALIDKRRSIAMKLAPLQKGFKPDVIELLRPWADQYKDFKTRYKFLVLRGASRTGKSTLAKALCGLFGFGGSVFVQTVQSALDPDLRNYDSEFHSCILFDNVNDMRFVLDQRALFQSNNDLHKLGESKTGMYSYTVWLYQVPLVVTVDMSAKWDPLEPWICENCCDVLLTGPSWVE